MTRILQPLRLFLKRHLMPWRVRHRLHPSVGITQRQLFHDYRRMALDGKVPGVAHTGFRVFSQFEEDGKLLYLFALIGMTRKTFVEIGADDGINSNAANLYFHFGWDGLFLEANAESVRRGKDFYRKTPHPWHFPPRFVHAKVTPENVNQLIGDAGFSGEIGLLSIDIDGHDYWVWEALSVINPQVVIIETHVEFGLRNIVVPYDADAVSPLRHPLYHGASPVAMVHLARRKGYRLVGANELGFNFLFVRNGLADDLIPEVEVASVLTHPSVQDGLSKAREIADWPYVEG